MLEILFVFGIMSMMLAGLLQYLDSGKVHLLQLNFLIFSFLLILFLLSKH